MKIPIATFCPDNWFDEPDVGVFRMVAYRSLRIPPEQVAVKNLKTMTLGEVQAVLVYGSLGYFMPGLPRMLFEELEGFHLEFPPLPPTATPEGAYVLLLTPVGENNEVGTENETDARLAEAAGLLLAVHGRNFCYEPVFSCDLDRASGQVTPVPADYPNPAGFRKPRVSHKYLAEVTQAVQDLDRMKPAKRRKIATALRWFRAAVYEPHDTDALLKYWLALEVLCLTDSTEVKPLIQALAKAYGITRKQAGERFKVEELLELRNQVVHDGEAVEMMPGLREYLEALFADVLFYKLGLEGEQRVAKAEYFIS